MADDRQREATPRGRPRRRPDLVHLALALVGCQRSAVALERAVEALADGRFHEAWAAMLRVGPARYLAAVRGRVGHDDLRRLLDRECGPSRWLSVDAELSPDADVGRPAVAVVPEQRRRVGDPELLLACWVPAPRVPTVDPDRLTTAARLIASAAGSARVMEELLEQSARDPLTGLLNRRGIADALDRELARVRRSSTQMGLLFVDLDGFKRVNDRHGHPAGDIVLVDVACALTRGVRTTDAVGRLGGDEFVIMLHDTSPETTELVAARLAARIDALCVDYEGATIHVRCSIGAASSAERLDRDDLIGLADRRMLERKHQRGSATPPRTRARRPLEVS